MEKLFFLGFPFFYQKNGLGIIGAQKIIVAQAAVLFADRFQNPGGFHSAKKVGSGTGAGVIGDEKQ